MTKNLSASARKVQKILQAHGLDCQVVELPDSTRSARDAAAAIGCSVEQIVKSLVFRGCHSQRPVLVVASGPNRVNEQTIAALFDEPIAKSDAAFVRAKTGFVIGGVPPAGHSEQLPTFIDEDLLQYNEIWAAAGTPNAVFKLTPEDLQLLTQGRVVSVK